MVTGSFASTHYGAPRSTQDIDIVISSDQEQLRSLVKSLGADEYYVGLDAALDAHRRLSLFNIIDHKTGWKIDLIFRESRPFSLEEFDRRHKTRLHGIDLYVATPEDIIIAKLEWAKIGLSDTWIFKLDLTEQWNAAKKILGSPDEA